jgi:hypothetical protein
MENIITRQRKGVRKDSKKEKKKPVLKVDIERKEKRTKTYRNSLKFDDLSEEEEGRAFYLASLYIVRLK